MIQTGSLRQIFTFLIVISLVHFSLNVTFERIIRSIQGEQLNGRSYGSLNPINVNSNLRPDYGTSQPISNYGSGSLSVPNSGYGTDSINLERPSPVFSSLTINIDRIVPNTGYGGLNPQVPNADSGYGISINIDGPVNSGYNSGPAISVPVPNVDSGYGNPSNDGGTVKLESTGSSYDDKPSIPAANVGTSYDNSAAVPVENSQPGYGSSVSVEKPISEYGSSTLEANKPTDFGSSYINHPVASSQPGYNRPSISDNKPSDLGSGYNNKPAVSSSSVSNYEGVSLNLETSNTGYEGSNLERPVASHNDEYLNKDEPNSNSNYASVEVVADQTSHNTNPQGVNDQPHSNTVKREESHNQGFGGSNSGGIYGGGAGSYDYEDNQNPSDCICVPYYQCESGKIVDDGAGIIDPRKKQPPKEEIPLDGRFQPPYCGAFHVCCSDPETQTAIPYTHKCGIRNPSGINRRILEPNGKAEADFGEWPWQVAVLKAEGDVNIFQCGGTLIDSYHILTVAHCVQSFVYDTTYSLKVRLGEWDTQKTDEFLPHEDYDVTQIYLHPSFNSKNLWNDIALLRVDREIIFRPNVDSVCLPSPNEVFEGQHCVTTGWGKNAYRGGGYSNILKEVSLLVLSNYECQKKLRKTRLGPRFRLHDSFLCAGGEVGRDSCKGDGGGPLVCYRQDGTYSLAGIVSWGIDCGQADHPGVYIRVQKYLDWITEQTGQRIENYWSASSQYYPS